MSALYILNVVVIDDNTRHLTKETTRVFWEHSLELPVFEKVARELEHPALSSKYITLQNNHQGLFLATSSLLRAWKERGESCRFHVVRNRPGLRNKPSQPKEGTQRVFMSSKMLYGSNHCNVQLLLPVETFGRMNVHHLPNKNYRRVGRKGRVGGNVNGAKDYLNFENITTTGADPRLLKAYVVHQGLRQKFPFGFVKNGKYNGIEMVDQIDRKSGYKGKADHLALVTKRMEAYERYVISGGILTESDMGDYI